MLKNLFAPIASQRPLREILGYEDKREKEEKEL